MPLDERGRRGVPPTAQEATGQADEDVLGKRDSGEDGHSRYLRAGRLAWATLGIVGVAAVTLYVLGRVSFVVVPVVLALFPAALLDPLVRRLRRTRIPDALNAVIGLSALVAVVAALVALVIPAVEAEFADLVDSFATGLDEVDALLREGLFGFQLDGLEGLAELVREQLGQGGQMAGGALTAVITAVEFAAGFALLLVVLFFYLKDGPRMADALVALMPASARAHARPVGERVWDTLGAFLRGQLLIALVDAVFIGLGLLLLGVPLAFPLAVIVFFGGLFPIVGAFLSGLVAVLVALADGGVLVALAALGIVVGVQQVEGNILEPLVLGRVVHLHPVIVVVAVAAGGILLGVLGAFLAVPIVASIGRGVEYVRGTGEA